MSQKNKYSLGEISKTPMILIGVVIGVVVIVIIIISSLKKPPPPPPLAEPEEPEPVYEVQLGDIKLKLISAKDRGSTLLASDSRFYSHRTDTTTTEKFIEITITAENIGKDDLRFGSWDIVDVVDSEERIFHYSRMQDPWIPGSSKCGDLLKPGFSPTPCTKIYEVAKISEGLKIEVSALVGTQQKKALIDIKFDYDVELEVDPEEEPETSTEEEEEER